jgi:putative lipoic acid-binding regulatory protein
MLKITELSTTPSSPIEYPCQFPIKILAKVDSPIEKLLKETLEKELQNPFNIEYTSRISSKGTYHSITAMFTASNREELDRVYQILSQNKDILWMI